MKEVSDINFINNQQELRGRLIKVVKHSTQPLKDIANEIGINRITFVRFMNGGNTYFNCLAKIEIYVVKYEKILDLV